MGKALIIAEKPSVAADIARALGGFKKQEEYFESDKFVLSSAVGHLLQLAVPEGVEPARGKWSFAHLPVIPDHFDLKPIEKSASRLRVLEKLIKRKDVDALINACDAGREGEHIFRCIVRYTKTPKPIQRLWLQSMTAASIREGFERLRTDAELQPLAEAAVCRSEADWLVGINGTRAMTAFNSKTGGFHLTTVGRVQTPTLAVVVEREERIRKFVARDYWEIHGTFQAKGGSYEGRWFDEKFTKDKADPKTGDAELKAERVWALKDAEAIRNKCLGKPGIVTEESKPTTQAPPLLYDLTSLQREANNRFGFSASTTLKIAQALYERHKVLTYPRTDARALPEDYMPTVKKTLEAFHGTAYNSFADTILKSDWVKPNKRVFNNAKVSDHFAIIPTTVPAKMLNELEQKLYDMVTRRFLAVFYPSAEFLETTRITRVEGEPFKSMGKVLVNPGWLAVYGRDIQTDDTPMLAPVRPNEQVDTTDVKVEACQTKPPPRFTEATLLSAMEGAGKLIEDEELREAMAAKGLGTPATRASIIEGLLYEKYLLRQGKELVPTAKAFSLMALLRGLDIPELTSPELTGEWEFKLKQMEHGELSRPTFMREIAAVARDIVKKAKSLEHDTIPGDFGELKVPCPKCGSVIKETYKKFQCSSEKCDFALWKIAAGRQFEPAEIEELITKRVVGPLQGFRSKMGKPFNALIKMSDDFKPAFDFGQDQTDADGTAKEMDFTGQEPLGKCPKCGSRVFEGPMNYLCEKSTGANRTCDFRTGKIILQRTIDRAQVVKLLETRKTDLLEKFISKKGRPFKAYLVVDKDNKVGFEFEPRQAKDGVARQRKPKEPEPKVDFTGQESIGKCPMCGGPVFESPTQYLCEKAQSDKRPCKFRSGKNILGQVVERDQMKKLLATGKTDLLKEFVSKKGRTFAAHLIVGEKKKIEFEFPDNES